jgi:CPA2 family monovalent cation:H+ antiporter-2
VLLDYAAPIALITAAVVIGKVVTCGLGTYLVGHDGHTSMRVGMALAQIGEFSFIIAALGTSLGVTSDFLFPIAVAVSALTTLFTPYLIRAAGPAADALGALTPTPVARFFALYTEWLQALAHASGGGQIGAWVRRILVHVLVNFSVVVAIFLGFAFAAGHAPLTDWLPDTGARKALLWGAACLLALPFLIAAYRKLKALSLLLVEASTGSAIGARSMLDIWRIVAELIPVAALGAMMLLVAALSASLLPPARLLALVLAVIAVFGALLWRRFVRWHSQLQVALHEGTARHERDD